MSSVEPLMQQNFLEYASYSILDRAIPELRDGCKPVQRRILHTLFEMNDGNFHKLANVIGDTMKLHPHGDVSIGDALIVIANKGYFVERQGNFGNPITGHPAAAPRYIECRLSPLALETLFNRNLTEFVPSYDGRNQEPVCLPAKLPVALLVGIEGIAVGMATRILPHNFCELLRGQIDLLEGRSVEIYPDFMQGGLMDVSEYDAGRGKIKLRAKVEAAGDKKVVITQIPATTTTESLIASIESASQKNRVKISGIQDYTSDHVEIELSLGRGMYADEVIPQLFAYTDCEVSLSSSIVVIRDRRPVELTVTEILGELTDQLKEQIRAELQWEMQQLQDRQHWLTLEQIFIEERVYKKIEKARTAEKVKAAVQNGMREFENHFIRPMTDDDVNRLLEIRIRRISAYDIEKHHVDMDEVQSNLKSVRGRLRALKKTTIAYLNGLLEKYGPLYPRKTKVTGFESVDRRAVASANLKLSYDAKSGFFGSDVRGQEFPMTVTEFDRVLAISSDGSYRILAPPARVLLPRKLIYCEPFDTSGGIDFTLVYRDGRRNAFGKRVHIEKFITDKEYRLFRDPKGKIDLLIADGEPLGQLKMNFVQVKRQRTKEARFNLGDLVFAGLNARGTRLAQKSVSRLKHERDGSK
jgi:topoisomerase-4 subunit A